jgi:hypothetical protein
LRRSRLLLALTLVVASCGSEPPPRADDVSAAAWDELLADSGLRPDRGLVRLAVRGGAPRLEVTVTSRAEAQLTFADALYGATAHAFTGERWVRVDTAEIRTQVAPLLDPGESATFQLPVREAASYRVLVPIEGKAAWADSG